MISALQTSPVFCCVFVVQWCDYHGSELVLWGLLNHPKIPQKKHHHTQNHFLNMPWLFALSLAAEI